MLQDRLECISGYLGMIRLVVKQDSRQAYAWTVDAPLVEFISTVLNFCMESLGSDGEGQMQSCHDQVKYSATVLLAILSSQEDEQICSKLCSEHQPLLESLGKILLSSQDSQPP